MKFLAVLIAIAAGLAPSTAALANDHPNVLLIVTDDQGYGDLGLHGNKKIDTPHLDSIGKTGMQLEKFHVCPNCAPTRASLLTGRYHYRTGVASVSRGEEVMRGSETTLAEVFRDHGYATGCFGKWHNGNNWPHNANGQGFDEFLGISQGHWNSYFDAELEHNGATRKTTGFVTDVLTDEAIGFMKARHAKDQPFFCYVPYNTPHSPFQCPDALFNKYKARDLNDRTAAIYAMIESIDTNVGRMLTWLSEAGIEKETIVIFMSDNGPGILRGKKNPEGEKPRFNGYFYGGKGSVHEGGVRVPCFIRWLGTIPEKSKFSRITAHIDLLPTLVDLCGLANFDPRIQIDGKSLAEPLLHNGNTRRWPNRILFTSVTPKGYDTKNASVSVRTDRWLALRDARWQRGETDPTQSGWELYDLQSDPFQNYDVASEYPFLVSELRADFSYWLDHTTKQKLKYFPTEIGHPEWPEITLLGQNAMLSDPENWDFKRGNNSWISNWSDTDQSISWPIKVIEPGLYSVAIDYRMKPEKSPCIFKVVAGEKSFEFTFSEGFFPDAVELPDRFPRGEVAMHEWKRLEVGEILLESGIESIGVTPIKLRSDGIELKNLILRNTTAPTEKKP